MDHLPCHIYWAQVNTNTVIILELTLFWILTHTIELRFPDQDFFWGICPPPGLLPVLGPCEWYLTPTLDAALLISARVDTDPGLSSVINS